MSTSAPNLKSRRSFLLQIAASSLTLAAANTAVYTIGSAFKDLDGSLVAGAKSCGQAPPAPSHYCGVAPVRGYCQDPYYTCNSGTGNWDLVPGIGCSTGCR